jgi:hypothetical protein
MIDRSDVTFESSYTGNDIYMGQSTRLLLGTVIQRRRRVLILVRYVLDMQFISDALSSFHDIKSFVNVTLFTTSIAY